MKHKKRPYGKTEVVVCMGYKSFYDDYEQANAHKILNKIPSQVVLKYVAEQINNVLYALNNTKIQLQPIREYCLYVPDELKHKIQEYMRNVPSSILYETYGCCLLYGLILQNHTSFDEDDDYDELCVDEYEPVFKAITYCNQRWTDEQSRGMMKSQNAEELYMLADMPIIEYKRYKDFKFQLYNAMQFFRFLETDPYYKEQVIPAFYADHKVSSWKQYISRLFNLYRQSIHTCEIDVSIGTEEDYEFFKQYAVDPNDEACAKLWEGHNAISYLRDHFLYPLGNKKFLLLNANFLIDKIYQGVKFDIFRTIQKHGIKNIKGNDYVDRRDFLGQIGEDFSESHLLYALMRKTFAERCDALYTGNELKALQIKAEPDLYMRIGKSLFLFEFKDLNLGDPIKYSADIEKIKNAIIERICLYTKEKRKGAGQLHHTIENIFVHHSMDTVDGGVISVEKIYPIIVVPDRAFSASGVQSIVVNEIVKFPRFECNRTIYIPIIVDFDTLIDLSYRFHRGDLELEGVLKDYITNSPRNMSFSTYAYDIYRRKSPSGMIQGEVKYLYEDLMD